MDKSTCEFCGESYRVVDSDSPERDSNWDWQSDLTKVTISFEPDPYNQDVNGDSTPRWICSNCVYTNGMEI